MMRHLVLALFVWPMVQSAAPAQCEAGPPQAYDSLHESPGDFRNVRGFTYLAVYPSLNTQGAVHNGSLEWRGVASPTVMWENYEPGGQTAKSVQRQLSTLKGMGVNTIRVFMSFPTWEFHHQQSLLTGKPNAYNERVADFFLACRYVGIKVIPVIWDNTGVGAFNEPNYGTAADYFSPNVFHYWHSNPGVTKMMDMLQQGGGTFLGTLAETYILDLVAAASVADSVAIWEVMNEPFGFDESMLSQMVPGTLQILDAASDLPIMLGLPWWDHTMHVCARLPQIDILSIHHYAHFATHASLRSQIHNSTHIRLSPLQSTQAPYLRKPLILAETGSPGMGHHYADAIDQAEFVRRPDLGPAETGVGFLSFSAMNGWQHGNYPFKHQGGVLYADCTVRDHSVVDRMRRAAKLPRGTRFVEKTAASTPACPHDEPATTDNPPWAGYVGQSPIPPHLDNYSDRLTWMKALPTDFLNIGVTPGCPPDFGAYVEMRYMFEMSYYTATAAHDLASAWILTSGLVNPPGLPNGNPYADATSAPQFTVIPPAIRTAIEAHMAATDLVIDGSGNFVPTPFTNSLLAQSSAGPLFDPRVHPEHLALLCVNVFDPWRVAMKDYVIAQAR